MISFKWKKAFSLDRIQKAVPMMKNEWNKEMNLDQTYMTFQSQETKGMKNKHRQNLRWFLKEEKPKEERINFHQTQMVSTQLETQASCPNDQLQMEKWKEHRQNLKSCPNDEKRVQPRNELRLNLNGIPMIANKRDEE